MKTHIKDLSLLSVLITGLGLPLPNRVTAQTFTTLYSFASGSDGAFPNAGLILWGNAIYGTAADGGSGAVAPNRFSFTLAA
jgi:hypothetical protein